LTAVQRRKLQGSLERQLDELGQTQAQLREEIAQALIGRRGVGTDEAEDPEGGSLAFEQAQTSSLLEQSERHVREIRAALERIEAGSYGACQSCGEPIAAGRLEARPFAALCIECAS
jgi:RNA polymerase-binding protein DksA